MTSGRSGRPSATGPWWWCPGSARPGSAPTTTSGCSPRGRRWPPARTIWWWGGRSPRRRIPRRPPGWSSPRSADPRAAHRRAVRADVRDRACGAIVSDALRRHLALWLNLRLTLRPARLAGLCPAAERMRIMPRPFTLTSQRRRHAPSDPERGTAQGGPGQRGRGPPQASRNQGRAQVRKAEPARHPRELGQQQRRQDEGPQAHGTARHLGHPTRAGTGREAEGRAAGRVLQEVGPLGQEAPPSPESPRRGRLFVISGPSGVGKGTVVRRLLAGDPSLYFSVSAKTRAPRSGEVHGVHYWFIVEDRFDGLIERDLLLEIDVQGAAQIRRRVPDAVLVFLAPPSREELTRRLLARDTEQGADLERRLAETDHEMAQSEWFDHVVVNDLIDRAVDEVAAILERYGHRPSPAPMPSVPDPTGPPDGAGPA